MAQTGVIIVAGGVGRRMGATLPKQFMMLGNSPILVHTINRMHEALPVAEIVVVLPEEYIPLWNNLSARFDVAQHRVVAGGKERFHSVAAGLAALSDEVKYIAVHDGVRPLVSKRLIIKLILAAENHETVIPAIAPADSCRVVEGEESKIIDRNSLRLVQTPQVFQAAVLRKAYTQPFSPSFTDDASVVEQAGGKVHLCEGERTNIKITTPEDISFAEAIINCDDADIQL
ncbi:MAG: 2-C-methyl-D-erythritol 4-phosphate cytidylyltransferase [Rikenellaceae bacterium]|nr:2-C-methyl-D-erythritol 4-phosphate cytidylyltransferase [Rikenellaceae bacterium]